MPDNMQKKPKVADLELDPESLHADDVPAYDYDAVETMPDNDKRYQAALELLRFGNTPKQITDKLLKKGIMNSRPQASRLAMRVMKEHPEERQTNAKILLSVAGIAAFIGALFLIPVVFYDASFSFFSPSNLLFLVAAWFAFKGYQAWQSAK